MQTFSIIIYSKYIQAMLQTKNQLLLLYSLLSAFFIQFIHSQTIPISSETSSPCPILRFSSYEIQGFQTGTITLLAQNVQTPGRIHDYSTRLNEDLTEDKSIAVSIVYIDQYQPTSGIDYSIRPTKAQNNQLYFQIAIKESDKWSSIHAHYLISKKSDFVAGFFSVPSNQIWNGEAGSKTTKIISHPLPKLKISNSWPLQAEVFISGIEIEDSNFSIEVKNSQIDGDKLTIVLALNSAEQINQIYFSYLVYGSVGSLTVSLDLGGTLTQILSSDKTFDQYFIGIQNVNSQLLNAKRRMLVSYDDSFFDRVAKRELIMKTRILSISESPSILTSANQCVAYDACEENGGEIKNINEKAICVLCDSNKQFDPVTQTCVCKNSYILVDGQCVEPRNCAQGEIYWNDKCYTGCKVVSSCPEQQVYDEATDSCICDPALNLIRREINGTFLCVNNCVNLAYLNTTTLECDCYLNNQFFNKTTFLCQPCPLRMQWDNENKKCYCKAPLIQNKDQKCIYCSSYGYFNQEIKDCVCNEGYEGDGIKCTKIPTQLLTLSPKSIPTR